MSEDDLTPRAQAKRFLAMVESNSALGSAYCYVFDSPEGKTVMADLSRRNFLLETTAVAGDAYMTAHNEGRRAALLDILGALQWSDGEISALSRERITEAINVASGDG